MIPKVVDIRTNQPLDESDGIIGEDPAFQDALLRLQKVALVKTRRPVLLLSGETGTGKGLFVQEFRRLTGLLAQPIVSVNCGAIPTELFESELFGYGKGAFTGADSRGKAGLLERAEDGVLFLDEVNSLSLFHQTKLLRILEDRQATRVGLVDPYDVKAWIVLAVNKPLHSLIREDLFREDLYYRISAQITIPPLRERKTDIMLFWGHFVRKYGFRRDLSLPARQSLIEYPWPGNVRELANLVWALSIFNNSETAKVSLKEVRYYMNGHTQE